jgi:hypothetical protein
MRQGNLIAAGEAFEQAMARVAMHPMARVGLAAVTAALYPAAAVLAASPIARERNAASVSVDSAFARAAELVLSGAAGEASVIVHEALANAPSGSAGWLLPVEPILRALDDPGLWGPALSRVRNRAA